MKKESMSASVEVPFEQLQTYTSSVLSKLSSCQEKLATTQEKWVKLTSIAPFTHTELCKRFRVTGIGYVLKLRKLSKVFRRWLCPCLAERWAICCAHLTIRFACHGEWRGCKRNGLNLIIHCNRQPHSRSRSSRCIFHWFLYLQHSWQVSSINCWKLFPLAQGQSRIEIVAKKQV